MKGSYILILFLFIIACQSEADEKMQEEQRLNAEVEKRLADYERITNKNCQERVLTEAIRIADSLIILEARLTGDTSIKPFKPLRPDKPPTQILNDTTPVKPFLKLKPDSVPKKQ